MFVVKGIRRCILSIALLSGVVGGTAAAAPVDLLENGSSGVYTSGPTTLDITGGTFSSNDGLYIGSAGGEPTLCGAIATERCYGDMRLDFDAPVTNLSIQFGGYDQGDFYLLYAFGETNNILTSYGVTGNGSALFASGFEISYMIFAFGSDLSMDAEKIGMYFHSFEFDLVNSAVSTVPLPAGLPLFASALALIGLWRSKQKQ